MTQCGYLLTANPFPAITLKHKKRKRSEFLFLHIFLINNLQLISTTAGDVLYNLPILLVFVPVGRTNNCEVTITIGFCSNSFVSILHAQALQQDPSAYLRDRTIDCTCWVLTVRVDTIWYTVSCTKSVHFSASLVELALESANDGNADDIGVNVENDMLDRSIDQRNLLVHHPW